MSERFYNDDPILCRIAICSHMQHKSGSLAMIGGTPRYPSSSSRSSVEADSRKSHDTSLIEFSSCMDVFLNAKAGNVWLATKFTSGKSSPDASKTTGGTRRTKYSPMGMH